MRHDAGVTRAGRKMGRSLGPGAHPSDARPRRRPGRALRDAPRGLAQLNRVVCGQKMPKLRSRPDSHNGTMRRNCPEFDGADGELASPDRGVLGASAVKTFSEEWEEAHPCTVRGVVAAGWTLAS